MAVPKVIIVVLRRPKKSDKRADPLWEFGSFGCTGCHKRNLLNPRKSNELIGVRLAFAQGGRDGFKLVHLTPPIKKIIPHGKIVEVQWSPKHNPMNYKKAPLLIDNDGNSDFPYLKIYIDNANCPSMVSKFSSKFRTCRKPLDIKIAKQMIRVFEKIIESDAPGLFASNYLETFDKKPLEDKNRLGTYMKLKKRAECDKTCK